MGIMLADYDPGYLTGFYILFLTAVVIIICFLGAAAMLLMKKTRAFRKWMIAAGICFALGTLLFLLAITYGKTVHLL